MNDEKKRMEVYGYKFDDIQSCVVCARKHLLNKATLAVDWESMNNPAVDIHGIPMDAKDRDGNPTERVSDVVKANEMICRFCKGKLVPDQFVDIFSQATVSSPSECDGYDYVVCGRVSNLPPMPDALEVGCSDCGELIYLSKTAPAKPPKICLECMTKRVEAKIKEEDESGSVAE